MRRFNWRRFKRKGLKKLLSKDEKIILKNIKEKEIEDVEEVLPKDEGQV